MPDPVRFHLDEHISNTIARALTKVGIDVTTTVQAGLRTKADEPHLEYAAAEGRVLVTHDADFLGLAAITQHAGIAYCAPNTRSVGQIIRSLIAIHQAFSEEEMRGRVHYL